MHNSDWLFEPQVILRTTKNQAPDYEMKTATVQYAYEVEPESKKNNLGALCDLDIIESGPGLGPVYHQLDEGLLKLTGDGDKECPLVATVLTGISPGLGSGHKLEAAITEWLEALLAVTGVGYGLRSCDVGF